MVGSPGSSKRAMLCATLRTSRSLLDEALAVRVPGEAIRFWEDRSPWRKSPYPLWRVYAESLPDSKATGVVTRSSTYRRISRAELEEAVGRPTARKLWVEGAGPGPRPRQAIVVALGVGIILTVWMLKIARVAVPGAS